MTLVLAQGLHFHEQATSMNVVNGPVAQTRTDQLGQPLAIHSAGQTIVEHVLVEFDSLGIVTVIQANAAHWPVVIQVGHHRNTTSAFICLITTGNHFTRAQFNFLIPAAQQYIIYNKHRKKIYTCSGAQGGTGGTRYMAQTGALL